MKTKQSGQPAFLEALLIILVLLSIIFLSIFMLDSDPHIPLIFGIILLSLYLKWKRIGDGVIEKGIKRGMETGLVPIMILSLIGMLIGIWMMSGTVPSLLFYGFDILSPEHFLISTLVITILVSSFTGSAFTTIGTIGVALIGIATGLGIDPALAAGAIISGAAFGDKMSPLSDTTNFAPGVVGVGVPSHIRHMMWTTVPGLVVTAVVFMILGDNGTATVDYEAIKNIQDILYRDFHISILTFLSPLLVLILSVKRMNTITIIIWGIASGIGTALFTQDGAMLSTVMTVLQSGFSIDTGNEIVDGILNRGGLQSMMGSISLILLALSLGGILQESGIIHVLISTFAARAKRMGDFISMTALSSITINISTGEQYLSILLPGQSFKEVFKKRGIPLENLSRTLEDAGTLVNPLIPWGVSGAFFATALGIPVVDYVPYAVFLYISPFLTVLLGYLGIGTSKGTGK